jgi:hypothetical protein
MIHLCEKFCPEELKAAAVTESPGSGSDFDESEEEVEEEEDEEEEEQYAGEAEYK